MNRQLSVAQDYLYGGDGGDNTIKRFDAITGDYLGTFAKGHMKGPRGLIFDHEGDLLVSNQNVDKNKNGNILKFDGQSGKFLGELVRSKGNNAPFAPRGIVLSSDNILYVADFVDPDGNNNGEVRLYNGSTGVFLDNLDYTGFTGEFHPRGLVIGPDNMLYVSVVTNFMTMLGGAVLRFDLNTRMFVDVFVSSENVDDFNRPEGLVFGPNGNLYVTSFKDTSKTSSIDRILVFNSDGTFLENKTINLDNVGIGQPRAFAQAILFGPNKKLFVPITGNGPDTGSVRRYNEDKTFDVFVQSSFAKGPLKSGWYLTFGKTNPATLAYEGS